MSRFIECVGINPHKAHPKRVIAPNTAATSRAHPRPRQPRELQVNDLALGVRVALDVALRGPQRRMAGKLLHVAYRCEWARRYPASNGRFGRRTGGRRELAIALRFLSKASVLGYLYRGSIERVQSQARIESPHGSLELAGISIEHDLLAGLCRSHRRIRSRSGSAPTLRPHGEQERVVHCAPDAHLSPHLSP